ncbi:MAG: DUF554 domain-containing protein [Clostridium sp.]|nr:DUF554 domain-containing protein [Clostridium sp.]MBP3216493.1 DUF554 domain-containing protein [Clostridium sp.]MBQ4148677.1 DUF554 domain-containing protein [Clostridium sp.]MBQ5421047.1 DUF554 domain-containing protein [Clostridium sp.]HAE80906.1 DUF554 domain-containing protein [Lachnoclostridium sp.]
MIGLGTIMNVAAIIGGGVMGLLFGKFLKEQWQTSVTRVAGVCTLFIGMSGTLAKVFTVSPEGVLTAGGTMMMIVSMVLGTLIGEIADIEGKFESFGLFLRNRTGNAGDSRFINAFVTASLTVCIGAMAIVGAIQDGIYGDYSILATKGVLDFIIIAVMASAMGKGAVFSAVPVGLWQGTVTILARLLEPLMTEAALDNISLVGNIMIFCVGINLLFPKTLRVANMLPGLVIAAAFACF